MAYIAQIASLDPSGAIVPLQHKRDMALVWVVGSSCETVRILRHSLPQTRCIILCATKLNPNWHVAPCTTTSEKDKLRFVLPGSGTG